MGALDEEEVALAGDEEVSNDMRHGIDRCPRVLLGTFCEARPFPATWLLMRDHAEPALFHRGRGEESRLRRQPPAPLLEGETPKLHPRACVKTSRKFHAGRSSRLPCRERVEFAAGVVVWQNRG